MFIEYKGKNFYYELIKAKKEIDKCIYFFHGWGGSVTSFKRLISQLGDKINIVNIDFWGFGSSSIPNSDWNLNDYIAPILKIMALNNYSENYCVAHSFGGRVAIKLAINIESKLKKIVLIDSAGLMPKFNIKKWIKIKTYKLKKQLFKMNLIKKEKLYKYGSKDYKEMPNEIKSVFNKIIQEDLKKYALNINIPTLIIWGEKDKDTPVYMAKKLNKLIKDSGLIIFEKAGHFSYLERELDTVSILKNFLLED